MKQPKDFSMPSQENKMCELVKSLYGLKQVLNNGTKILIVLLFLMIVKLMTLTTIYIIRVLMIDVSFFIYIYDILILTHDINLINDIKTFLSYFDMKDPSS